MARFTHPRDDHHVCLPEVWFGPISGAYCICCGAAANDPTHGQAPCEWCDDPDGAGVLGAPAPFWHRWWCRLIAKMYGP